MFQGRSYYYRVKAQFLQVEQLNFLFKTCGYKYNKGLPCNFIFLSLSSLHIGMLNSKGTVLCCKYIPHKSHLYMYPFAIALWCGGKYIIQTVQ